MYSKLLGMIWNYEFFSKEAFLQSKNEQTFDGVCFDLTEKFLNSQNSVQLDNEQIHIKSAQL